MSPITPAGGNWQSEVNRLRNAGFALSRNPVMARLEASRVADSVSRGSLTDMANRKMAGDMNRRRAAATRGATGGMIRTASDLQMAMPKMRQPLALTDGQGHPVQHQRPQGADRAAPLVPSVLLHPRPDPAADRHLLPSSR